MSYSATPLDPALSYINYFILSQCFHKMYCNILPTYACYSSGLRILTNAACGPVFEQHELNEQMQKT